VFKMVKPDNLRLSIAVTLVTQGSEFPLKPNDENIQLVIYKFKNTIGDLVISWYNRPKLIQT
jgi:hypothetical protein